MARSATIWLVQREGDPVAAFTVKHELISWLKRQPIVADLTVFKMMDAPYSGPPIPNYTPLPAAVKVLLTSLGWPW